MEVKTTDTDIAVNLQVLLQVLVVILVSLDIL
ncbi:spore coat protein [Priestia megaterium]|nr:spore coat protein [Priestia megaterium]